jgi:hypothetical protein
MGWMRRQWREEGSDVSRAARTKRGRRPICMCVIRCGVADMRICISTGCDLSGLEVKTAEIAAIERRAAAAGGGIGRSFHE